MSLTTTQAAAAGLAAAIRRVDDASTRVERKAAEQEVLTAARALDEALDFESLRTEVADALASESDAWIKQALEKVAAHFGIPGGAASDSHPDRREP